MAWRRGLFPYDKGDGSVIKPQTVIETLCEVTKGDAFVTSDVGQHQMFAAQYYRFNKPNRWINSGGLGTMGFGFPAAMGVKLNFPDHDVACVTGEGSIQMNIQELSTCMQYGLPVKIVNLNNGVLGMVRQWQDMATTVVTRIPTWSRCLTSSSWPRPMAMWASASPA
jgi:acetolactate synthase-1/2/3 large subunit